MVQIAVGSDADRATGTGYEAQLGREKGPDAVLTDGHCMGAAHLHEGHRLASSSRQLPDPPGETCHHLPIAKFVQVVHAISSGVNASRIMARVSLASSS